MDVSLSIFFCLKFSVQGSLVWVSIIWLFCKAKFQLLINARRKLNAQFFATCLDWRRQARESSLATHIYSCQL